MSKSIFQTSLRLNLNNEEDRRAWEHLRNMDRSRYKSYSRAVVAAVNEYFDRQETAGIAFSKEKEDAFLQRVLDAIERAIRGALSTEERHLPDMRTTSADISSDRQEMETAALEFLNSL